uniref:Uncharacterized protein n=1 Tax=Ciona savignyi TaxID=51511 RepID=H2YSB8_CIOSA
MENLGHMIDFMRTKKEKISWALRFRLILDIGCGIKLMQDKGIKRNVLATDVIIDKNIRAKLCFAECDQKLPDYAQMFGFLLRKIALGWVREDKNQLYRAIEHLQGWNFISTLSSQDKRIAEFLKTVYDNCTSPDAELPEQISMLKRFFDAEISWLADENAKELSLLMIKMSEFQKPHQHERKVLSDVSIKEKISYDDGSSSSLNIKSINQSF